VRRLEEEERAKDSTVLTQGVLNSESFAKIKERRECGIYLNSNCTAIYGVQISSATRGTTATNLNDQAMDDAVLACGPVYPEPLYSVEILLLLRLPRHATIVYNDKRGDVGCTS